jgi:hypothetical protein
MHRINLVNEASPSTSTDEPSAIKVRRFVAKRHEEWLCFALAVTGTFEPTSWPRAEWASSLLSIGRCRVRVHRPAAGARALRGLRCARTRGFPAVMHSADDDDDASEGGGGDAGELHCEGTCENTF